MDIFLDILKSTLPALIVFLTVFYLLRSYIQGQLSMKRMEIQKDQQQASVPLRLQAYERLILLCERVSLDDLMLRLRTRDMTSQELKNVLMLAVKQEFDHNLSQQLYVSAKLWEILSAAKDQLLNLIIIASNDVGDSSGDAFSDHLLSLYQKNNPILTAKSAVVKEGQMYF